jgi:4-carboxymuconolactone decarboxylase
MLRGFLAFSEQIRDLGVVEAPVREIVILRIAQLVRSEYEWLQHVSTALASGVTKEQIASLSRWRQHRRMYSQSQLAALPFVEALHRTATADNATFRRAQRVFSSRELVELATTVGWYELIARIVLAFEVAPDEIARRSASGHVPVAVTGRARPSGKRASAHSLGSGRSRPASRPRRSDRSP